MAPVQSFVPASLVKKVFARLRDNKRAHQYRSLGSLSSVVDDPLQPLRVMNTSPAAEHARQNVSASSIG